ncbi:MAG: hypothetical protein HY447_05070 [Candidatus Omnitrophica bacterium]|nr:hypothetical protein [Candidatus Omnitrophota bacterium]
MGNKTEGQNFLSQAIKLNPMDHKARRLLGEMNGKPPEPKKREKPWRIYGSLGSEYDDNVALRSSVEAFQRTGDQNALRFNIKNGFSFDYIQDATKRLGSAYTFTQSIHTDSLEAFNFRNHSLQHYGSYSTYVLGKPVTLGLKYTFEHGELENETFSSSNSFFPWVSVEPINDIVLSVYDDITVLNFRNKGFKESVSSRDGLYNTAGVMTTLYASQRKRSLSLSYEFGYNQAEGDSFDARVHAARVFIKTPLIEKFRVETFFSVIDDNHHNFAFFIHRHDVHLNTGVKLIRPITEHVDVEAHYSFTRVNNLDETLLGHFEYSRHIVGGSVSYSF